MHTSAPTPTPPQRLAQAPHNPIAAARKQSMFAGWLFKVAIASALLLTLSWAVVPRNRRNPQPSEFSSSVPVPAVVTPVKPVPSVSPVAVLTPAPLPVTQPVPAPATTSSVQVLPGETLYRISVKKLGRYDHDILNQLRGLNLWINDPGRIQSGRLIRLPSASITGADARQRPLNPTVLYQQR